MFRWLDCQCSLYTAFILALLYFIPDLFPSLPHQRPLSTSLPLFSHLASFFFCHLTCPALLLPRHQTGSSQNYFMLLWTLRGLCSWALCPALPCQRAAWGRGSHPSSPSPSVLLPGTRAPGTVLPPLRAPFVHLQGYTNCFPLLSPAPGGISQHCSPFGFCSSLLFPCLSGGGLPAAAFP